MKNIALTGFMGTGKSRVGRELAKRLGWRLIDVDTEIEKQEGMKISDIFARFGEPRFRDIEAEIVRQVAGKSSVVISTGGGVVLREENLEALRKGCHVVCLGATPETILKRTSGNTNRPLLQVDDPLAKIKDMLSDRAPFYEKADITVDTDGKGPLEIAEEILAETVWKK